MKKILFTLSFCLPMTVSKVSAQDSISVLFIGNSYTYVNNLPMMVSTLATNLGKKITVDSKTGSGTTFQGHLDDPATDIKIHSKPWDVVVIQGQSLEPSNSNMLVDLVTIPNAVRLSERVWAANACSNVMYYMTWGRQNGSSQSEATNTFEKMNARLYKNYLRMADSSDRSMVSPVGAVWGYVRANHPTINLYDADGSHPSFEGSYLAACTFYTSLFQKSPVGATYYGGLNATTAGILQQAAATVILDSLDRFHLRPANEATKADFSIVQNGSTITLTNESSRATTYTWLFGDGQSDEIENAEYTFTENGVYTVSLVASSECNSDTISKQVAVGGTLSLSDLDFAAVEFRTKDEFIEVSCKESGYSMEVFGTDGKQLIKQQSLDAEPVLIPRNQAVQLVKLTSSNGAVQIVRCF